MDSPGEPIQALDSVAELARLLEQWQSEDSRPDPVPILTRLAELVERETEAYFKMDPDPFDDRHPSRARPDCTLGHLLKSLFRNDEFMNELVNQYVLSRESSGGAALNTAACRLLLDVLPGLETSVVFQDTDGLVARLLGWAEAGEPQPLAAYATGLLAAAMEVQDVAANFRDTNARLVPIMLQRLWKLSEETLGTPNNEGDRADVAGVSRCSSSTAALVNEGSNSSWAELEPLMIGSYQVYPLTGEMQQRLILQYLTPLGEYQELLGAVLEARTLHLLLRYVDLRQNKDVRLAFEALKYLASLLCHKKFALEFIAVGGLQKLLDVHRPSVAATGVSICLYYLAYSEDAMERVCLLPQNVLSDLVEYALWLLECSHDSSRCHATMFFGLVFPFRPLLELFDARDGLRKLLNVMSTLDVFVRGSDSSAPSSDEQVFASRQTARHVCVALKRYFEAHLALKAEQVRRAHARNGSPVSFGTGRGGPSASPRLSTKAARGTSEALWENVEILLELLPARARWHPAEELVRLGGVSLLLQTVAMAYEWNHSSKADTVRAALDVLAVCSVVPKVQLALCQNIPLTTAPAGSQHRSAAGMSVILAAAEGEIVADPDVQRSALNITINCVCGPTSRLGGSTGRMLSGGVKKKPSFRSSEDLLGKLWHCVRANNGIMVLLNLLTVKSPITDADSLRALACKALCGLARCNTVRQIISKLPLFTSGQLQVLMREPVLQDKRGEHVKFCHYCMQLVERVTGAPLMAVGIDTSLDRIQKSEVVAQTKIRYRDKDLLQLIYQHLLAKGLGDAAAALQREASLPSTRQAALPNCCSSSLGPGAPWTPSTARLVRPIVSRCASSTSVLSAPTSGSVSSPSCASTPAIATPSTPVASATTSVTVHRPRGASEGASPLLQKRTLTVGSAVGSAYQPSPVVKRLGSGAPVGVAPGAHSVSLDSIVKEYLRQQHALCKNPVVTCPPFELFVPHRCPEPQYRTTAPLNMASRWQRSQVFPPTGGCDGAKLHRKFVYSRFRPVRTFRDPDGTSSYSCCAFSSNSQFLFLGTLSGELHVYNLYTGLEEATYTCHESELTHCQPSKDGKLLLTSSAWRRPLSSLWTFTDVFEEKLSFDEDYYVEFGKQNVDRVLGTKYETAHIYDTATGSLLATLKDPDLSNRYTRNRATFNPTDDLVLSDGVLWDVRTESPIHKFDKFNANINGVFHPNGLEVISNTEVWDLRSFRLLHTVPSLDQCHVAFNGAGNVLYGAVLTEDDDESSRLFGSSFRTFDASDYSSIATIDIKKNIFDLKTDLSDYFLAIVENQGPRDASMSSSESICRLYEVGRQREDDDDEDADEEEESDGLDDETEEEDDDMDADDDPQDDDDNGEDDLDLSLSDNGGDEDSDSDQVLFALNEY